MPRTLITGGTGFIGCRLAELWHSGGRSVRATGLVRNPTEEMRANGLRKAGVPLLLGDLTSAKELDEVLADVDTVIHLAAAQHEANVGDDYFVRINVDATRQLLTRCEEQGVARFFYASSIGVYGINNDTVIDENTELRPDNAYGRSKAAAEAMLGEYMNGEDAGIQVFIGRIGETYGPWDMRLHKLYAGIEKGRFWLVGRGRNLHQPIYVDDLALAIGALVGTPGAAGRPVILSGASPVTTREMCESIAASLDKTLSRWKIPMWPLVLTAAGMESTLGKAGIQPPLHRRRLDFFRKSLTFSTALREALLSLPPQLPFEEGARRTANWYRGNGWL